MDQMYLHGGAEKIVSAKINSLLSDFDQEVYLLTTEQEGNDYVYPLDARLNAIDLGVTYNRSKSFYGVENLVMSLMHFFKLRRIIAKINPDIIVSVSQTPDQFFLPFISRRIAKVKELHSSGYVKFGRSKSRVNTFLADIYKHYDALVVLNKDERQYYKFDNLEVIPNFFSKEASGTSTSPLTRSNTILFAGRIAPVKQIDHLIEAWKLIEDKHTDWKVHIYGDGDEVLEKSLRELIHIYALQNIKFRGSSLDMDELMQDASIFALTSSTECFPMVLLESMSNGLPIISYDCPHGPRNIITHNESGVLVKNSDIQNFAKELSLLIENREQRRLLSVNATNRALVFSKDIVMEKWMTLFNSIKN